MKFHSIQAKSPEVAFKEALFNGLPQDKSLYVPCKIPKLPKPIIKNMGSFSFHEIACQTIGPFIKDIPSHELKKIIARAFNFPIPLIELQDNFFILELFHGPTLAFKDIGARFMAEVLSYFLSKRKRKLAILVATSGDTGSAVAHSFRHIKEVALYILYPSGKISHLQEQQMTTLGGNVCAIEVTGSFDDCQNLVKQALVDKELLQLRSMSTANSVNVGRLIPQIAYYAWAFAQWKKISPVSSKLPIVVVPSGNFGNLTAAAYCQHMGIPIEKLVAATNINDTVPRYIKTGVYAPRHSIKTLSTAMDVGNPSNFPRLQLLYNNSISQLRQAIRAVSITDKETLRCMREIYNKQGYLLDPHSGVGVAAAQKLRKHYAGHPFIITATAHPAKFPEIIEKAIKKKVELPKSLQEILDQKKKSVKILPSYNIFKKLLLANKKR